MLRFKGRPPNLHQTWLTWKSWCWVKVTSKFQWKPSFLEAFWWSKKVPKQCSSRRETWYSSGYIHVFYQCWVILDIRCNKTRPFTRIRQNMASFPGIFRVYPTNFHTFHWMTAWVQSWHHETGFFEYIWGLSQNKGTYSYKIPLVRSYNPLFCLEFLFPHVGQIKHPPFPYENCWRVQAPPPPFLGEPLDFAMWRLWARPATKTFMLTCSCKGASVVRSRWGSPGWMSKDPFEKEEIRSGIQPGTVFFLNQFFGCGSVISPPQRGRDNHLQQDPWRESHHPDKFQHPSSKRFRIINTQSLKTQALRRSSWKTAKNMQCQEIFVQFWTFCWDNHVGFEFLLLCLDKGYPTTGGWTILIHCICWKMLNPTRLNSQDPYGTALQMP